MKTSLADYLIKKRLDYAAELLKTTQKSTMEISLLLGYESYSYFFKLFKKTTLFLRRNTATNIKPTDKT